MKIENLMHIVIILETAERQGMEQDTPEGSRYIVLSDTLAKEMIAVLRETRLAYDKLLEEIMSVYVFAHTNVLQLPSALDVLMEQMMAVTQEKAPPE